MQRKKKVGAGGIEPFSLDGCHQIHLLIVYRKSDLRKLALLRSWVQLPPGPFLPVVHLRYALGLFDT
ncbi:MAG TPA: hypothetical protein VKA09_06615 [Nitrososphaeraceae archaeon]|nr:hypothetical protein [Nitrososphaeraceae archaeon]